MGVLAVFGIGSVTWKLGYIIILIM